MGDFLNKISYEFFYTQNNPRDLKVKASIKEKLNLEFFATL